MKKNAVLLIWLAGFAGAEEIEIETPVYGGSGCLAGSAQISLSPKHQSISMQPENYVVNNGERKACMLVLPIHSWPAGHKIALSALYLEAEYQIESRGTAVFQAEFFLAGLRTKPMNWVLDNSESKKTVWLKPKEQELIWSGCAGSNGINFRVNTSLLSTLAQVKINKMRVKLRLSPC